MLRLAEHAPFRVRRMLRFKTDAEATQLKELMEKHAPR
jgi:hypothetical protein